ncbi:MAG: cell division protein FtsZ, partial [Deltaproteobacteria bacterium]
AEIFWGVVLDDAMGDEVQVTVIATGIDTETAMATNVVNLRDLSPEEANEGWTVRVNGDPLETPTFRRRGGEPLSSEDQGAANQGRRRLFSKGFFKDNLDYPTFLRVKAD